MCYGDSWEEPRRQEGYKISTYVMTDIHGHYGAMKRMLDKIGFSEDDRLICAGDYIDRGPDSYGMLRWIESSGENIILVRGNHDEKFPYCVEAMGMIFRKYGRDTASVEDTLSVYGTVRKITSYFDLYGIIGNLVKERRAVFNHGKVYRMDCIFYDLDCGYGLKDVQSEAKLACLRLEDERVFYI